MADPQSAAAIAGVVFDLDGTLYDKRDLIIRNLVEKLLAYALGRGLSMEDSCAVDQIMDRLREREYNAHTLILEIIRSQPFRYKAPRTAS